VACSVGGPAPLEALAAWVARHWNLRLVEVGAAARQGGVVSGYAQPGTLGADRWANLLGARAELGPVDAVLVDAGTAVTVDALRADGCHLGGAILAGLTAARSGLRRAAPALPTPRDDGELPATDTATAMGAGTLIGLAGAVERVAGEVAASLAAPRRILTGGDAARLRAALGEGWELDPQLTLRGLRAAVEESCAG
jgi:type III pantothenate kinase